MKTKILAAMFGAMLMVSAVGGTAFAARGGASGPDRAAGEGKVEVCHNDRTISVNGNAVEAHQGHSDTVGPCEIIL